VENAIKHGASKIEGASRIEIPACREGERLVLGVRDNGPHVGEAALRAGDGVGLRNTQERLLALYGSEQSLMLRPADNEGVIAEVIIPYRRLVRREVRLGRSAGLDESAERLGE
jgi:sensor histidine kinase YesM